MPFVTRSNPDRWDRDPLYVKNRAIVRAQHRPCRRCGKPIAYEAPYWVTINGRKHINPRAFVCGHVVSRINGGGHELANLRAECAGRSIQSGAHEANLRRRQKTVSVAVWPSLDTSRRW